MFKNVCVIVFILVTTLSMHSQDAGLIDKEYMKKGSQIIEDARKQIGIDKLVSNIDSFQLSIKSISDLKGNEVATTKEMYILLPDKILSINATTKPFESKSTSIWNGEKYKKLSESITPDGQRTVRDITSSDLSNNLSKIVKDRETLEKLKKATTVNPREKLNKDLWSEVFPLILMNLFQTKTEFKYVGKAKSAGHEANIVDIMNENNHSFRLFFDSETNYLLMMVEKYSFFDGDYESNYYFSNRELMDKILIPKKIKIEHKFTPTGGDTKLTNQYIDVIDFKINPRFKPNLFDIN